MHKNIIQHLKTFIDLSENEVEIVGKYIETIQLKKKEFVLQESKVCRNLYFVEKGCLRMFFINKKGSEQITQFALDGWWISDYQSFMNNTVSDYYIQSIEASTIVSIDSKNLDSLLIELPELEKYFRKMMQKAIAGAQLRSKLMYEMSKEEFYFHFSTSFPEFMMRVPQYMIASYLGLTPEYLSELRKKTN
ncbi:MAG: Crp/Fnr family transcriptional regulator [Bacteroidales bacterium]